MSPIKCVFMGSDPIAIPMLKSLVSDFKDSLTLDAVFTQPDRKTGRGKKRTANAIKIWAQERDIPVFQPEKIGHTEIEMFRNQQWNLALVMAYGHILKDALLEIPSHGFFNLHASILPKLRGASPIETAIVTGENETGVTMMKVIKALDAGPILATERYPINKQINALELRQQLAQCCIPLLQKSLPLILSKKPQLTAQDENKATYCRLIDKLDGWIDFKMIAQAVLDHINGFYPWPGAYFEYNGILLKIGSARIHEQPDSLVSAHPGQLFCDQKQLFIQCKDLSIEIQSLQKPGGKMISVASFLNGFEFKNELTIKFPTRHPLVNHKYFKNPHKGNA